MNQVIASLFARKSVRSFEARPVPEADKDLILDAAIQAPSAGNQALYAIVDVVDPALKAELAETCDHQPFIASAPVVLVFLADCRRWLDCYRAAGVEAREPGPGDLLLACEDALVAAQNAVVAAESLGLGSCYIGDILENRERHAELLGLDRYTVPIAMLVMGYPTAQQRERPKPPRLDRRHLVHRDRYSPRGEAELRAMHASQHPGRGFEDFMRAFAARKYESGFALELNRSAADYIAAFDGHATERRPGEASGGASLVDLAPGELRRLEPLWERNRAFHEASAGPFAAAYRGASFAARMAALTALGEDGMLATVAVEDGRDVGYCVSTARDGEGELATMHVIEGLRGRGVGRALASRHLAWMRERGCASASVTALAANGPTLAFYRSLGFRDHLATLGMDL